MMSTSKTKRGKSDPLCHIFLSYSRIDAKIANWIVRKLQAAGYKVWIDTSTLLGGARWSEEIVKAIRQADAFVLLVSPDSASSNSVRKELDLAAENKRRIIPLQIRPMDIPDAWKFHLAGLQRISLWRRRQTGIAELIASLGGERKAAKPTHDVQERPFSQANTRFIAGLLRFMQEDSFSVSHVVFSGGEEWQYYVQFLVTSGEDKIYAEAVGNDNLEDPHLLTAKQIDTLLSLGWKKPNNMSFGNYHRTWRTKSDDDRSVVASKVMQTFLDVYNHYWDEQLEITDVQLA